jgi:hypothetical protein
MATYKYAGSVQILDDHKFDKVFSPNTLAEFSGIYRCTGCGRESANVEGKELPPQNHHQHGPKQGAIEWQLIVATS